MAVASYNEGSLSRQAKTAEWLDPDTEQKLARAWRDQRDEHALHRLISAYMRLAISMAAKYRHYGAPMNDLIQEASLGLMKAADKFDPDRGVRFSTYAVWWIKASVQDYVMRNWSLVRTGSTSSQKALFFNLRRVQAQLGRSGELDSAQLREAVAREVGVPLADVEMMEGRLGGMDMSLNMRQSGEEDGREWQDVLEDENAPGAAQFEWQHDQDQLRVWLGEAMDTLNPRERFIVTERRLREEGRTLEDLGAELGLSKERVRQLESGAYVKLRKALKSEAAALL